MKTDMKSILRLDKVVFDKKISAPEVFKLVFDSNDKVISIENLEFDDLK